MQEWRGHFSQIHSNMLRHGQMLKKGRFHRNLQSLRYNSPQWVREYTYLPGSNAILCPLPKVIQVSGGSKSIPILHHIEIILSGRLHHELPLGSFEYTVLLYIVWILFFQRTFIFRTYASSLQQMFMLHTWAYVFIMLLHCSRCLVHTWGP